MAKDNRIVVNAAKTGMDVKTARKYLHQDGLPSELGAAHMWRTREDPFEEVWAEVHPLLELNPGLEAKTLFEYLQRTHPGRFPEGQLRSFQRGVRRWRALEGPPKEVFFEQEHQPGYLCQSDFTYMHELGVTIGGEVFDHLLYHFVLTYSNWESGTVCFSESYESLSEGLQAAVWELGAVPAVHQTDRMTAAVCHPGREEFTQRYAGLLRHYGLEGRYIRVRQPNENGDIEQRHHRFKRAVDQALMLRGSRDFASRADYDGFLKKLFAQLNAGRARKLEEEGKHLRPLPTARLDCFKNVGPIRVTSGSTIKAGHNIYSVDSRLIGEEVRVHLYAEHLEVWYAQRRLECIPRLRGQGKHRIQYRHVIDWLVRKPAAFENYRYRADLFPSSRFRRAYDELKAHLAVTRAAAVYLAVLKLAADESEELVERALGLLFDRHTPVSLEAVAAALVELRDAPSPAAGVTITPVDVGVYDGLLQNEELSHAAAV
ncbi:MAG TPA: IS21 family transposase [Terriglobales bacterium]|nr:IS21 family transposase [Terriglobales bacterium]